MSAQLCGDIVYNDADGDFTEDATEARAGCAAPSASNNAIRVGSLRCKQPRSSCDLYSRFRRPRGEGAVGNDTQHDADPSPPQSQNEGNSSLGILAVVAGEPTPSHQTGHPSAFAPFAKTSPLETSPILDVDTPENLIGRMKSLLVAMKLRDRGPPSEAEQLAHLFTKMDMSFQTYPCRVMVSGPAPGFGSAHALPPTKSDKVVATTRPGPMRKPRGHAEERSSPTTYRKFHTPPNRPTNFFGPCGDFNPHIDSKLYFSHCYNWLESVAGFSRSQNMKAHLTQLLEIMSAFRNDGLIVRDRLLTTIWVNPIFSEIIEFEREEILRHDFSPLDYVHPTVYLQLPNPFAVAMGEKEKQTYTTHLMLVTKRTKKTVPVCHRSWFFRNESSGNLSFLITVFTKL